MNFLANVIFGALFWLLPVMIGLWMISMIIRAILG